MRIYKVLSNDSSHMFVLGSDNINELKFERVQNVTDVWDRCCQYHSIYAHFNKCVNSKKIGISYNYVKGVNGIKMIKYIYLNNIPIKKFEYNNMNIYSLLAEFTRLRGYTCSSSSIIELFTCED